MENAFIECFWQTATALIPLITPIIALFVLFRLVHDILWR